MQHCNKCMVKCDFLVNCFQEEFHLSFKIWLFANIPVVEKVTKETAYHWKHLWVHVEHTIQIMHTIIEDTHQGIEDGIWNCVKQYKRSLFLKNGLNAMFDNICVFMMLNLVENDIDEFSFRKDQVIALNFNKVIK